MLILIASILLLVLLALAFTQTAFFKRKLKEKVETIVGENVNAEFTIGELEGNFYNTLVLNDIEIATRDTASARVERIQLNYDLLAFRNRVLQVDSLIISQANLQAYQDKSGTWSFQKILPEKKDTNQVNQKKKPLNVVLNVGHFELIDATLAAHLQEAGISLGCRNLNILANGRLAKNNMRLRLGHMEADLIKPDIRLKKISGIYAMNNNGIQLDSLLVLTGNSDFDLNAKYHTLENLGFVLNANKLDHNELALFIPRLQFKQSPVAKVDLKTTNNQMMAKINLSSGREHIEGEIKISPFSELIQKNNPVKYSADLRVRNLKLENWIASKADDTEINGSITLSGMNLLDTDQPISLDADLSSSHYHDIYFERFEFDGDYTKDSITGYLEIQSKHGQLSFDGKMLDIQTIPQYHARVLSDSFNLTALLPKLQPTIINGSFDVKGRGFKSEDLRVEAGVKLGKSRIYHIPLDTMETTVSFSDKTLDFGSVELQIPGALAQATGRLDFDSMYLFVDAKTQAESLIFLDSIVQVDVEFEKTDARARIFGPVKDLALEGDAIVKSALAYGYSAENTNAKVDCRFKKDSLEIKVNGGLSHAVSKPVEWDTISTTFRMFENEIWIDARADWIDTLSTEFRTSIELEDTMAIKITNFTAATLLSNYYLDDTLKIYLDELHHLDIKNLRLKDNNNPNFFIDGDGTISMINQSKLNLRINDFQIRPLNRILDLGDTITGLLDSDISVLGTDDSPIIKGDIYIKDPAYGSQRFEELQASFNYENQFGQAKISTDEKGKSFLAEIESEFKLSMDSLHFKFSSPKQFKAGLKVDSLSIHTAFRDLIQVDSFSGTVVADVAASGSFDNPLFYGTINIDDGHYTDENLGLRYNDITTKVHFEGKEIILDTLLVKQKNGYISATGSVEFDSTIIKGNISSSSLQADAESFFLTQHRNYEILLDANTFLRSKDKKPEFGGKVYVKRSDVFLPAILKKEEEDNLYDTPLLVDALKEAGDSSYFYSTVIPKKKESKNPFPNLIENLSGRLTVEIPRNTWIKSDDMRLELSGEVDIVKTGSYFELFGNIDIVRGHYILYGKKLNLEESQLVFQGGEELNPTLNFLAEYVYRDGNKDKRYLELIITGELQEPEITFMLDGAEISETDGVSVLIFGATSDEIGYGGQNGIVGSIGSNAVASVITSQLSRTIGTQFNLDMIEITATENWQSAAFVVGKYITNDIFIIYQRGFGETDGDEITPETITVEYELNDKIFLRLQSGSSRTSGVDLLLKLEQEMK